VYTISRGKIKIRYQFSKTPWKQLRKNGAFMPTFCCGFWWKKMTIDTYYNFH